MSAAPTERARRLGVYVLLVALAIASVASGRFGIALAIAGAKTLLVGVEYMELRHAHRAHLAAFATWVVALVAIVALLAAHGA